jgi:hypothetical protein
MGCLLLALLLRRRKPARRPWADMTVTAIRAGRRVAALVLLGLSSLLLARTTDEADRNSRAEPLKAGANAHQSGAPRVGVDRPKPTFPLYQRDKRVHGLKPFQPLVDAAPAGSVLKPPPGRYAGPVVLNKPLTIDGGGQVTIDAATAAPCSRCRPTARCCADCTSPARATRTTPTTPAWTCADTATGSNTW